MPGTFIKKEDCSVVSRVIYIPLAPCMFCGFNTAWTRPSPIHADNAVCFDCIPKMTQLWEFQGLTEPKGD